MTSALVSDPASVVRHLSQPGGAAGPESLADAVETFLGDLVRAGRSPSTARAYRSDLRALLDVHTGTVDSVTAQHLRDALRASEALAPASRARKQAAWAASSPGRRARASPTTTPTVRLQRVRLPTPLPRAIPRHQVEALLAGIPTSRLRDRVAFLMLYATGARVGEVLAIHVEDVTLNPGDERVRVVGKGRKERSLLLDDPQLIILLRRHLRLLRRATGPVFTSERGDRLTPLTYEAVRRRWHEYCRAAGVTGNVHALRHSHAVELVDGGVRIETIRKRLGHSHLSSTARYAQMSDRVADAELRDWRRTRR